MWWRHDATPSTVCHVHVVPRPKACLPRSREGFSSLMSPCLTVRPAIPLSASSPTPATPIALCWRSARSTASGSPCGGTGEAKLGVKHAPSSTVGPARHPGLAVPACSLGALRWCLSGYGGGAASFGSDRPCKVLCLNELHTRPITDISWLNPGDDPSTLGEPAAHKRLGWSDQQSVSLSGLSSLLVCLGQAPTACLSRAPRTVPPAS